jgi:nitrite reductase (cytochrome c-552)
MVVVFVLGLLAASVTQRRAEVASIFNNKKVEIKGIEGRNEIFGENYPREYETWKQTADTSFQSMFNGSKAEDVLAARPNMVVLWAGYAFAKDYKSPRGHMHAIEDVYHSLRTGAPMTPEEGPQPATCWTCKSPDVPRMMQEIGVDSFYKKKWAALGSEIVNPIGCADCHDAATMDLHISRPGLVEAFQRRGMDIKKATQQEMRSLVCAQCHVEYYMKGDDKYLTFPWDKGLSVENMEAYYDEIQFSDFTHKLSKALIIKAQHPDYEIAAMGIHAQRGVSCADCHMPYKSEGGIKYSDHHIMSPLAMIDRTCQVCHRESEETLRNNVYDRQKKAFELRDRLEVELAKAHLEAQFAWGKGATDAQMKDALKLIRQAMWRWDFAVASHGGSFHAPQEIERILGHGLDKALQARMAVSKALVSLGYTADVPLPDVSTKEKAQKYIGLDIPAEESAKAKFLTTIVPEWLKKAKENKRLM